MRRRVTTLILALAVVSALSAPALAADPVEIALTVEKNRFQPEEVKVKAGAPFVLAITNNDAKAVEFESKELRVEKVIPPGKTVKVRVRALKPGSYPFFDDFNKQMTGRIVAE
jgi:plastocyanin